MVDIAIVLNEAGTLSHLKIKGHVAGAPRGKNLACAAVSLMVRSVARLVTAQPGWKVNGDAPEPGDLSLAIQWHPNDMTEWLKGVTDTLLRALIDIDEEYPSALSLSIEEKNNGT